jgi:hypothetical protein
VQAQPRPAYAARLQGRRDDAQAVLRTYIASARERTDRQALVSGLFILADQARQLDRVDDALAAAREGLALVLEHQFWPVAESAGV